MMLCTLLPEIWSTSVTGWEQWTSHLGTSRSWTTAFIEVTLSPT
jgi:hypothetical protein